MQAPHGVKKSRSAAIKRTEMLRAPLATMEVIALTSACTSCDLKRCSTLQPRYIDSFSAINAQPTLVVPRMKARSRTAQAASERAFKRLGAISLSIGGCTPICVFEALKDTSPFGLFIAVRLTHEKFLNQRCDCVEPFLRRCVARNE